MDLRFKIGTRLKAVRLEKELTQEQLAQQIDISHDVVSNVERGVSSASLDLLETFCVALGYSVTDLFDDIDGEEYSREKQSYIFDIVTMLKALPEKECRKLRDIVKVSVED